jgi:xylose isomerase
VTPSLPSHPSSPSLRAGFLGSIDANTGDELLGWDTDQFPMNIKQAMLTMWIVMEQGGLAPGGLNFDAKVRRESTDLEDIFIGHAGAMDTFARGLKAAAAAKAEGTWDRMLRERYATYDSGIGKKIEDGAYDSGNGKKVKTSFADLEAYIHKHGEASRVSGKQELYEVLINSYV